MTTQARSFPLVALVLVLVFAVVAIDARVVIGGKTWSDPRYHVEVAPSRLAAAEIVQGGAWPAWWEGTGLGVPLAAEPTHGAMYPPTWIAATPHALDLVGLAHLAWAAIGMALWARRRLTATGTSGAGSSDARSSGAGASARSTGAGASARSTGARSTGASEPAAVVAALLVISSGLFASLAVRGALPAVAHLSWIGFASAWLADATDRRTRAHATALLGVLVGLVALSGVLAGLIDAIAIAVVIGGRRHSARYLGIAIGAGLAIGLAQWLPALLHLGDAAGGETTGLVRARLVELIVPGSFGASDADRAVAAVAGDRAWAPSLFVGATLFALAAVRTPARRVLGLISLLAALVLVVGLVGWPWWLGAPEIHLAALVVVLAANAGDGLDALLASERRAIIALGVGGLCTAIALGAFGALRAKHPEAEAAIDRALLDGGLGLVCVAAALVLVWRAPKHGMPFVLALLVLPSVGARPSIAPVIERASVDEPSVWATAAIARERGTHAPMRLYRPMYMHDGPQDAADAVATLVGTAGWRWGIGAARSEDPARSPLYDRTWLAAAREGGALLDRFSIELAILPETVIVPRKMRPLGTRGTWTLAELPVAPAASVLRGALWSVDPSNALDLMYPTGGGTGVLRGTIVLRGSGPARPDRGPPLPCTIERWDPGAIDVACTTDTEGYAAISSAAAPGWTASVDGRETGWLTADVLRRAVPIAAGTHAIEWRYRAPGLTVGLLAAVIAALGLLAMVVASRRARA